MRAPSTWSGSEGTTTTRRRRNDGATTTARRRRHDGDDGATTTRRVHHRCTTGAPQVHHRCITAPPGTLTVAAAPPGALTVAAAPPGALTVAAAPQAPSVADHRSPEPLSLPGAQSLQPPSPRCSAQTLTVPPSHGPHCSPSLLTHEDGKDSGIQDGEATTTRRRGGDGCPHS